MRDLLLLTATPFLVAGILGLGDTEPTAIESVNFERRPDGRAFSHGEVITWDLETEGVVFPDGVEVQYCATAEESEEGEIGDHNESCSAARSGRSAITGLLERTSEFQRQPITIEFTALQRMVSLYVRLDSPESPRVRGEAQLCNYDDEGRPEGCRHIRFTNDGSWHRLSLGGETGTARVRRAIVTGNVLGVPGPPSNFILVDDLEFEGDPLPRPTIDDVAPQVTILDPEPGALLRGLSARFELQVEENVRLRNVDYEVIDESGRTVVRFEHGEVCRPAGLVLGTCPERSLHETVPVRLGYVPGRYSVGFKACDFATNCSPIESIDVRLAAPPPSRPIDLWVMGIEYNQNVQDVVFTDLDRAPGQIGWVPVRNYYGFPSSEMAAPIVPGKPIAVRVYIGLRAYRNTAAPAGGFPATGRLLVDYRSSTDLPRTLRPISNPNCADAFGNTENQECRRVIGIYPPLAVPIFATHTDYDLDLVDARSHLEGTLNFVIPPSITSQITRTAGLRLRAIVEPGEGFSEVNPGDNEFRLELDNIATPQTIPIDLVRVSRGTIAPPTRMQADSALADFLRMTTYAEVEVLSDTRFTYHRRRMNLGAAIPLDECQTVWFQLFRQFGLERDRTLLGLLDSQDVVRAADGTVCGGTGWRVALSGTSAGAGTGHFLGGIAWSVLPTYSGDAADDWTVIGTLAQEIYHAHLDRRHASNAHGEAAGCVIADDALADIIAFATGLDTDCWKPSTYAHGRMGAYPTDLLQVGRPGGPMTHASPGQIYGNRGAMGLRIEPDGDGWRLVLYDPCPTGPVPRIDFPLEASPRSDGLPPREWPLGPPVGWRTSPVRTISQRWDVMTNRYRCAIAEATDNVPHSFMSYGPIPWASTGRTPLIYFDEASAPSSAAVRLASYHGYGYPRAASQQRGMAAKGQTLLISGLIDDSARVAFAPVSLASSVDEDNALQRQSQGSPLQLRIEFQNGRRMDVAAGIALATPHRSSAFLFFEANVPKLDDLRKLTLMLKRRTLGEVTASANAPRIKLTAPVRGEVWKGSGDRTVRWDAADEDGDEVEVAVAYSPDGGMTWTPLGVVVGESSFTVPASSLPSSKRALIRVSASDGLRTALDQSDRFFVTTSDN